MKVHTNEFKQNVKLFGRQLDSIITYEIDGETIELGVEQLNSVSPIYEGAILKSVMKELHIDSNVYIPIGTILNYQFGVKTRYEEVEDYRDNYDYIDFGNYIVKSIEINEDTESFNIVCYDKLLYSMVDYENMNITYPITIRNYINEICTHLGLIFANSSDTFANYNREIQKELYLDDNGNSLGYTFRDVLDELAQVTASTICINDDDELEIRYITDTNDTIDEEYLKDVNVKFGQKFGKVNSIVISRSAESDSVYLRDEQSVLENGLCEIKIKENQIMNWNDRSDYLQDILNTLDGLEFYINDFSSTGITYYDVCDRYNIQIGENTYSCVMFNDEINITQGLEENIYTEMPEEGVTDYKKADKTDRKLNQTYIIVDKQTGEIETLASRVEIIDDRESRNYEQLLDNFDNYAPIETIENVQTQVTTLQTNTYTKTEVQQIANGTGVDGVKVTAVISTEAQFDKDGMHYSKTDAPSKTTINYAGVEVDDTRDQEILYAGIDENTSSTTYGNSVVRTDNLTVKTYLQCADGKGRIEKYTDENNNVGVGFFLT